MREEGKGGKWVREARVGWIDLMDATRLGYATTVGSESEFLAFLTALGLS